MNHKVIVGDINSYIEDNIGYIILDNPNRLNAISLSMWEKIGLSLDKFKEDKNLIEESDLDIALNDLEKNMDEKSFENFMRIKKESISKN